MGNACIAARQRHHGGVGVIDTERGAIGYAEAGSGDGLPIVFLHGVGSDKSVWRPQLDHFGRQRRAIAFDYPGYGDSAPVEPGTTRDEMAAAILDAMSALEIDQAHICGLSLGGVIAIAMHAQARGRCGSLILADTFAVHPDGRGIYERGLAASRSIGMRAMAQQRAGVLLAPGAPDNLRTEVIETMAAIDPAAFAVGLDAVWLADQRDRVTALDAPVLVLCGALDTITPSALSEALVQSIPGAELALIDGAGHLANIEKPAAFNAAVDRFISRVEKKN